MGLYLRLYLTTYLCRHARRLAMLLLALLSAVALPAPGRAADNTTRIILLFVVNPPDESSRRGVESWIQLFDINIQSLLADFASSGPDVSASIKVLLSRKNVDSIDQDGLETSFGQQASLQVL